MDKKEIRNFTYEVTGDEESRKVEGYALLFDTPSDGLSFEETIERGALDGVLEKSDVFALLNHDASRGILARWNGGPISLDLKVDEKGLRYSFEAPKTTLGDELLEYLRRGGVNASSFAFIVEKDTWEEKNDKWYRTIHKIGQLYDVSPVYSAAYSKTEVYMRGKEEAEREAQEKIQAEKQKIADQEAEKIEELFNI